MSTDDSRNTQPDDDSTRPMPRMTEPDAHHDPAYDNAGAPYGDARDVQQDGPPQMADPSDRPVGHPAPVRPSERPVTDPDGPGTTFFTNHPDDVAAREKEAYGGLQVGAAFFGWLVAVGLSALLLGLLSVLGVVLGVADRVSGDGDTLSAQDAPTVGIVALVLVGLGLFLAYFGGGYVAGRMARFDGLKQGLGVWLWALVVSVVLGVVGYLAGDRFDVLAQVDTLGLPIGSADLTTAGAVVAGAVLLIALVGSLLGGATGTHYHRKVDRVGLLSDPGASRSR